MALAPKQLQFVQAILSRRYSHHLFGGGRSCGKTVVSLGFLDEMCQRFPNTRYAVVRKSLATIRRNTIPSFEKILQLNGNPNRAELNKTDWVYRYKNGSAVIFIEGNIATDPILNKFRGLELTGFAIEEANEVDIQVFSALQLCWGRWNNDLYGIPPFSILTCNPDNNWVKDMFYTPWVNGQLKPPYYFMPALPHDNPHNNAKFLEGLENLPEAEYQRYVKGNWEYSADPNQLIQYAWLKECFDISEENSTKIRTPKYLGVDVAREGDDDTVICSMDDDGIIAFERHHGLGGHEIGKILILRMKENSIPADNVAIDAIGVGGGVIDWLADQQYYVVSFKASNSPTLETEHFAFANMRIQAAWTLREDIEAGKIDIVYNEELLKQIMQLKYFTKESKLVMESKDASKKRIGKSPDTAEAAILANWVRHQSIYNTLSFNYVSNLTGDRKSTMVSQYMGILSPKQHNTISSGMVY